MAQAGYTPIQLYYSTTTSNVPSAGNLASGELAINITDGKLFYKDNGGVVRVIAQTSSVTNVSSLSFGTTGLTPSTATTGAITVAGTLATTNGGTGLTSFTANGVVYASSTSALTTGSVLNFDGTVFGAGLIASTAAQNTDGQIRISNSTTRASGNKYGIRFADNTFETNAAIYAEQAGSGNNAASLVFGVNSGTGGIVLTSATEGMRLTSTGLGIGTSSPASKLHIDGNFIRIEQSGANTGYFGNAADLITGAPAGLGIRFNGSALRIAASSTQIAMFDSAGNLGLGVTPSAGTSGKVFQITNAGHFMASGPTVYIDANAYFDSGWKYITTAAASNYYQNSGAHIWQTAPSGTAGNAISFTQAMTLDASGNLLLNTTSNSGGHRLVVSQTNASGVAAIHLPVDESTILGPTANTNITMGSNLYVRASSVLGFSTNNTERARITSTGTFQLTNNYQEGVLTANTGTAYTIDLVNGTLQILTLTGNCTFTFPTATAGQSFTMLLRQDGTGGRTVTWPAAVRWPGNTAPTITSTASQTDKYIFTADGTRWYGSNAGQAYVA